jgi:uncharacterized protein
MAMLRSESDTRLEIPYLRLVRGERGQIRLRVLELADGTWMEIPLIVLRGAKPGPVFYLGAAFHGDEINGVELVNRFAKSIDLRDLCGTVLIVPVQNPLAFQVQHRYFIGHFLKSPLDQSPADPWISFPGDANGNMASQLSHTLFENLIKHADYLIDVHTPTTGGRYAPFAFLPPREIGTAAEEAEEVAKAFGADFILSAEQGIYVHEQSPHVVMGRRGAVAMGVEVGEGGRLEEEVTARGLRGLSNVIRKIGMLGEGVSAIGQRIVISSMTIVRARRGGLLHRTVGLNDEVVEGQVVATITDVFGQIVDEIRAPHAGPIVRIATFPVVSSSERVVQIGVAR